MVIPMAIPMVILKVLLFPILTKIHFKLKQIAFDLKFYLHLIL